MPTNAIDPKVLEMVNAGVGALAVVIFFIACFFAYPVIKQKNPNKAAIGLLGKSLGRDGDGESRILSGIQRIQPDPIPSARREGNPPSRKIQAIG